jgi:hypothetical protein
MTMEAHNQAVPTTTEETTEATTLTRGSESWQSESGPGPSEAGRPLSGCAHLGRRAAAATPGARARSGRQARGKSDFPVRCAQRAGRRGSCAHSLAALASPGRPWPGPAICTT